MKAILYSAITAGLQKLTYLIICYVSLIRRILHIGHRGGIGIPNLLKQLLKRNKFNRY